MMFGKIGGKQVTISSSPVDRIGDAHEQTVLVPCPSECLVIGISHRLVQRWWCRRKCSGTTSSSIHLYYLHHVPVHSSC